MKKPGCPRGPADIGVRDLVARGYRILSLGARARRGGGRQPAFSVAHCQTPSGVGVSGVRLGPVGSQVGTSGPRMVPYGSVYQSYTDTGQSSDPSDPVGACRVISGSDGCPSEP